MSRRSLRGGGCQSLALRPMGTYSRRGCTAAEREVRVLDKLRELQHEQFRYEQSRREINAADELATLGTTRQNSG